MEMTKELVLLYFRNKSNFKEDKIVEDWLNSSSSHPQQALRWIDELSDEEEKLFLKLALSADDVWKKTISEVDQKLPEKQKRFKLKGSPTWYHLTFWHTYRYAAVFLSVLMLALTFYLYRKHSIVDLKTKFEKRESIVLPDGTNVILNANSRLRYAYSWEKKPREVWLEGEGFFNVKDKPDHSDFVVYLSGKKLTAASGSVFNVAERDFNSAIFIKSGNLSIVQTSKVQTKQIRLQEGEFLELQGSFSKTLIARKVTNPEQYYSWTKPR